ncbi:MAG: ribosomal subunit interface protein [Coxiella sp. (in: Bacteria)]|nr:MAG: ribosomal subunit interface protein [Coxiella sp. (in: g-proteobacteria)]
MQVPAQVTFRDVKHSPEVDDHINEKVAKLGQYADNIISCQVVVEFASKQKQTGNQYNVRVVVNVPGKELVSTHNQDENMYAAIRDAFDDMTRQLEDYAHILHGKVKHHPAVLDGKVARVFDEGYGFIETAEGDEYYFNEDNVVHPKFASLNVGAKVHFIEFMGDEGPQAHRVSVHRRDEAHN